jgi:hypothetical protein
MRFYPALILLFLISCQNGNDNNKAPINVADSLEHNKPVAQNFDGREFTTSTGKKVIIKESHPMGMSLSDITVFFKDDTTTQLTLKDKAPISRVLLADLDQNNYDEIYIITTAAGSGSYSDIHGFYSNKDRSFSFIYLPEISEKDLEPGGLYHGYEGHDEITIDSNKITRTFPVKEGNIASRSISYTIKKAENGFVFSTIP